MSAYFAIVVIRATTAWTVSAGAGDGKAWLCSADKASSLQSTRSRNGVGTVSICRREVMLQILICASALRPCLGPAATSASDWCSTSEAKRKLPPRFAWTWYSALVDLPPVTGASAPPWTACARLGQAAGAIDQLLPALDEGRGDSMRRYQAKMGLMTSRWRIHSRVVIGLLFLLAGLEALIWFHPRLGYAQSGILQGADLRRALLQISIWLALGFTIPSTLLLLSLRFVARDRTVLLVAYAIGAACVACAIPILDKFY